MQLLSASVLSPPPDLSVWWRFVVLGICISRQRWLWHGCLVRLLGTNTHTTCRLGRVHWQQQVEEILLNCYSPWGHFFPFLWCTCRKGLLIRGWSTTQTSRSPHPPVPLRWHRERTDKRGFLSQLTLTSFPSGLDVKIVCATLTLHTAHGHTNTWCLLNFQIV